MSRVFRHGDVIIKRVDSLPEGTKQPNDGKFILAEGEATGHHHILSTNGAMDVLDYGNGCLGLNLNMDGILTHQEHKQLTIPAGMYTTHIEQEHDYFSDKTHRVAD